MANLVIIRPPFRCILLFAIVICSRVHISSDTAFLKILKKPSIVQE